MANGFIDWLHKKVVDPIGGVATDVAHDVAAPVEHVAAPVVHAVTQVPHVVNQDIVHPIERAPQNFINDVSDPVDKFADKSAFGRGLQSTGLGAFRAVVGLGQAASGLAHLGAEHNILRPLPFGSEIDKGVADVTKHTDTALDKGATLSDTTAKAEHANPIIYHGAQIAANLLPAFLTGGGSEAGEAAAEGANATEGASKLNALEKAQQFLTKGFNTEKATGRIAADTVRGITSPKNLAYNTGFQAYTAGNEAARGEKINPVSQAESLGVYQLGFPLLGAASKEGLSHVTPVILRTAKGVVSRFGNPALEGAEKATGLSRNNIVNDNEANMLRDEADRITGSKTGATNMEIHNTRQVAKNAGIDITTGSPVDRADRIYNYLGQRRDFVATHNGIAQGGYAKIPFGKNDIAPDLSDDQKDFVNQYANMLEDMDSQHGVVINPDGTRSSSNSPFYRQTFKETGKAPTKAQWFEEARKQLESGKGIYGASDEYGNIGKPVEPPKTTVVTNPTPEDQSLFAKAPSEDGVQPPTDNTQPTPVSPDKSQSPELEQPSPSQTPGPTSVKDILAVPTSSSDNTTSATDDLLKAGSVHIPGREAEEGTLITQGSKKQALQEAKDAGMNIRTKEARDYIENRAKVISQTDARRVPEEPTAEQKSYAETYNLTRVQALKDAKEMSDYMARRKNLTAAEMADLGPEHRLSVAEKRELINTEPTQQTVNQPHLQPLTHEDIPLKDRARSAIAQAEGINEEAEHRLQRASDVGSKMSQHDKELLYKYDDGAPIGTLLKEADNPSLFNRAATLYQDAMDYDLAAKREGGAAILKQNNYVPHNYDVSEEWMKQHGIPEDQWIKQGENVKGFRDTTAKYKSYADAEAQTKGALKPLYDSPIKDLQEYMKSGFTQRRNNLLGAALARATPGDIGMLDETRSSALDGEKPMTQAAGHLPFSASEDLQKQLKGYRKLGEPSNIVTKAGAKAAKGVNLLTKRVLFLGTPYHYMNEQGSFIGKNLLHPLNLAKGEVRFVRTVASKGGYQKLLDRAAATTLKDGTPLLETIRKMGVMLPDDSNLNRASSAFSLTEAEAALKRGLDPNSKAAVDLGQQINHLMGHRNLAVEGESPAVHQVLSFGTLAPSWSTTQLGLLKDALTKSFKNSAGNYARSAVIGKRVALGAVGVGGSLAVTHKLPNRSQLLNELGFTLKNPVPNIELNSMTKGYTAGGKKYDQEHQEMVTPTDPFGLGVGLFTDPSHFVTSRLSPLTSFVARTATNTNWNGEPLAEGPHNAAYYKELVENAAKNSLLPIGVQDLTNLTHATNNPNIVQGLEEDFGGRLKTNPNDPNYIKTQQYYSALNKGMNTLTPGSPAMGAFLETFGVTKDPVTGKYLETPNSEMTVAKSASLNAYPQAAAAANLMAKELKKNGQSVDPYYLLSPSQQKAYNAYETMAPLSADRTNWQNSNPWYNKFATQQQNYFNSLPPGDPNKPQNPIKYPAYSKQTTNDMNTYYALSNSTAKSTYLDSHPDVATAMNQQFTYDNAVRVARGYAPLKGYPTPTPQVQSELNAYDGLTSKADRTAYGNAHPDIYNFFEQASEYDLNKDASLNEIQGTNLTPAEVKTINSLGEDIYYNGGLENNNGSDTSLVEPEGATTSGGSSSSSSSAYIDPAYQALHDMIRAKKPSVVKLKKQSGLATPIKATYKKPKTVAISSGSSTISHGRPKISDRKVAFV